MSPIVIFLQVLSKDDPPFITKVSPNVLVSERLQQPCALFKQAHSCAAHPDGGVLHQSHNLFALHSGQRAFL